MFAKQLEEVLAALLIGSETAPVDRQDISRRFETLRSYGRLPMGRENRSARLTPLQVAEAVLGFVPTNPGWAGHVSTVLTRLEPVGGPEEAYAGARNLGGLVERLLTCPEERSRMVSLSLSMSGSGEHCTGTAVLVWNGEGGRQVQGYVSPLAVSLLHPAGRAKFNPDAWGSPVRRDLSLNRRFFDDLARHMAWSLAIPAPPGDGSEYDADDARRARLKALGVRRGARYLNVGVETHVSWPKSEMLVRFDGHPIVLMPTTPDASASAHIDLQGERLSGREALTVINRLLSIMAWEDDAFAVLRDGWSGNGGPTAVPRRNLANTITPYWLRPAGSSEDDRVRRALGYYREGRNAEEAELVSYAVLSYFKVIEMRFVDDSPKLRRWLKSAYPSLAVGLTDDPRLQAFEEARGDEPVEDYLWKACRIAVAHASAKQPSDPDDMKESGRLLNAAYVLRRLARTMVETLMEPPSSEDAAMDPEAE